MIVLFELPFRGRLLAHSFEQILPALARSYAPALRAHPVPPFYKSGVRYREETNAGTGVEEWDNPWKAFKRGWADCDDAVIWRLAELYNAGMPAAVDVVSRGDRHHVRIRLPNGTLEDPALAAKNQFSLKQGW